MDGKEAGLFGLVAYVHKDQGKLNPRSVKGVILSYPIGVQWYKVWLLEEKKCVISRNVIFAEDKVYNDEVKRLNREDVTRDTKTRSSVTLDIETGDKRKATKAVVSSETQEEEVN